ncbi:ATP-binding protein [Myroides odoratimimus]|uniref:AAA family ATPase n=1 Tax=Myroides odoratimimus TaxID=76832 RepID=UPI0020973219|nr:AAA family ATPase [Myroides odoratimimus]MCO7722110.1 ATP-binding protein [Myroides odoratimimus]
MQRQIKVKNFGPVKEGYTGNDGWINIHKVTVFIGDQGSGKSTVAKLIATFVWLEKALIRGDKTLPLKENAFIELLTYHRLQNYIEPYSELEYKGNYYHLRVVESEGKYNVEATLFNDQDIVQPKVMYVPAERNVLSSIENLTHVSSLVAGSLQTYLIEYRYAQLANKDKEVILPINKASFLYDSSSDNSYVVTNSKRLKVTEASSGFHSVVPLYLVTDYLSQFIKQDKEKLINLLSTDQQIRRKEDLKALNELARFRPMEELLNYNDNLVNLENKYICRSVINIVEELEQNLFPKSQRKVLNKLVAYNNENEYNQLVLTTHSPYLINYLTLAVKASRVAQLAADNTEALNRVANVVPLEAVLGIDDLVVYQLDEERGSIEQLEMYKGLPSDENYLNDSLEDINIQFSELFQIEDLCK